MFTNFELDILKSHVNWFLSMCNNYKQENCNQNVSIKFSVKACNNLRITDMIVVKTDKLAFSTVFSLRKISI